MNEVNSVHAAEFSDIVNHTLLVAISSSNRLSRLKSASAAVCKKWKCRRFSSGCVK